METLLNSTPAVSSPDPSTLNCRFERTRAGCWENVRMSCAQKAEGPTSYCCTCKRLRASLLPPLPTTTGPPTCNEAAPQQFCPRSNITRNEITTGKDNCAPEVSGGSSSGSDYFYMGPHHLPPRSKENSTQRQSRNNIQRAENDPEFARILDNLSFSFSSSTSAKAP